MTRTRHRAAIATSGTALALVLALGSASAQEVSGRGTGPGVAVETVTRGTTILAAQTEAAGAVARAPGAAPTAVEVADEAVLGVSVAASPALILPRTGGLPTGIPVAGVAGGLALVVAGLRLRRWRGPAARS